MSPVSAVVVSFGHGNVLARALASLNRLGSCCVEVVVVDNAGDLAAQLEQNNGGQPPLRLITPGENLGFAGAVNRALESCAGELLLLLSPDAELLAFDPPAVAEDLAAGAAAVGGLTVDQNDRISVSWGEFPGVGRILRTALGLRRLADRRRLARLASGRAVQVPWVVGAGLLLHRDLLVEVGGLDERYRAAGEDQDLGARLRRLGRPLMVSPHWRLRHQPRDSHAAEMADEILRNDALWLIDHGGPVDRAAVHLCGRWRRRRQTVAAGRGLG